MRVKITAEDLLKSKIVPPGWYTAEIKQCDEKPANTDKSQNWTYHFVITEGDYKGVKIYKTFNEKAAGRFVPLLKALGTTVPKEGTDFDPQRLIGKTLRINVVNELYLGDMKNQIAEFAPLEAVKTA